MNRISVRPSLITLLLAFLSGYMFCKLITPRYQLSEQAERQLIEVIKHTHNALIDAVVEEIKE